MPSAPIPGQPIGDLTLCQAIAVPGASNSAYTAGNAVGTMMTFANVATSLGSGRIKGAVLADASNQKANVFLVLFKAVMGTLIADKAAFSPVAADLLNIIDVISFATASYTAFTSNAVCVVANHNKSFDLGQGVSTMYGQLYTSGTPNYGAGFATALQVILDVEMD